MKVVNYALIASLVVSSTAFAQNSELDRLSAASSAQVAAAADIAAKSDEALLSEVQSLQSEVAVASASQKRWKSARTTAIAMTVGLATLIGISAYKGNRAKGMNAAGIWIVGGVMSTIGTVVGGVGSGVTHYQVTVKKEELGKLNERLDVVRQALLERIKNLRQQ